MVGETGDTLDTPVSSDDVLRAALPASFSRARVVITPYPFVAAGGDYLRVISLNSLTGVTLEIHGRQAARGFEGTPFRFVHQPLTNRMPKTDDYALDAGLVTNLSIEAVAGSPLIGQTFVIVQLVRSLGAVGFVLGTLLQGYVTSTQCLGWPGSPIESSIDGGGYVRNIIGTAPALGADFAETVPTGARWQVLRLFSTLRLNGAGNRYPSLRLFSPSTGASGLFFQRNPANAGGPWSVTFSPTLSNDIDTVNLRIQNATPPDLMLLGGDSFSSGTAGLLAVDQWDAPVYAVREWLEAT